MKNKKRNLLLLSALFIVIGCVGTYAKEPGVYSAFFAIGIVFLILGSAQKSK